MNGTLKATLLVAGPRYGRRPPGSNLWKDARIEPAGRKVKATRRRRGEFLGGLWRTA
jgi:hypothetical protein